MDDIEAEIQKYEQSLAATFKNKLRTMEAMLQNKDDQIAQVKSQLAELREQFDYNLKVIQERDEDNQLLQIQLEKTLAFSKEKNTLFEQTEKDWMDKVEILEKELVQRHNEIRDLQEKLKEAKRETSYYKKGYVEEVNTYKQSLDAKDKEIEDARKELTRVKMEEIPAIEARHESILNHCKASLAKQIEDINQENLRQKNLEKTTLDQKDQTIFRLQTEIEKLRTENVRVSTEYDKLVIDREGDRASALALRDNILKEARDKELDISKKLAVAEHQLETVETQLASTQEKLSQVKSRHVKKVKDMQDSYEDRILQVVAEYRRELLDKGRELEAVKGEHKSAKDQLINLTDKVRDAERMMRKNNDELQGAVREQQAKAEEEIHSLRNNLEVIRLREKDWETRAVRAEERVKKLQEDMQKDKLKHLDLQKENQILIDQVVALKEAYLTLQAQQKEAPQPPQSTIQAPVPKPPSDTPHINPEDFDIQIPSMIDSKYLLRPSRLGRSDPRTPVPPQSHSQEDDNARRECDELRGVVAIMKDEMAMASKQVETFFQANESLKAKYNDLLQRYEDSSNECMELKEKLIDMKSKWVSAQNDSSKHSAHYEIIRGEKIQLQEEINRLRGEYDHAMQTMREREDRLNTALESNNREREELIKSLGRVKSRLNKLQDNQTRGDGQKIDVLMAEIDRLAMDNEGLKEQLMRKDADIDRLRKNLDAQVHRQPKRDKDSSLSKDKKKTSTPQIWNFNQQEPPSN